MLPANEKSLKIVLLGSGNVATQMGIALKKAGHLLQLVYSPNLAHAQQLAQKLKCAFTSDIAALNADAQLYIVAVKDDAIVSLSKKLVLQNKVIVHTSGSTNINLLSKISNNYGVLYPLQTLTKQKRIRFENVPLCVEASNAKTKKLLTTVAVSISDHVHHISSQQRLVIHLAAVFACNFSNHMYSIAETILKDHKISFELLKPLILETAEKINHASPHQLQTGPALRGDKTTIANHIKLLSDKKNYQQLYKLISANITQEAQ